MPPPPPRRPPVRRAGSAPPPPERSDTVPESPAAEVPEVSVSVGGTRRPRVARRIAAAEPKRKSRAPLMVLVLLVLAGVGAALWWKVNQKPPPVVAVDPSIARGEELKGIFQEGKNLVRKGKWADAKEKFAQILAEQPDFAEGTVKEYLAACEKEIPNQLRFEEAGAALDKGQVGPAHRALAAISADTQQVIRRDELDARLGKLFDQKVTEGKLLAGGPAEAAKMKKLKVLAEDLLVARPEDRNATEFKSIADRYLRPRVVEAVEVPQDDPAIKVQRLFAQGDATQALLEAQACAGASEACRTLEGKLSGLNALLKRLEGLAPGELEEALKLDRAISAGKGSPQAKPIAVRLAAAFYPKASAARAKDDWALAMEYARKVTDAEPGHAGAQAILAEGSEKAHTLFLRCYQQKESNPEEAVPLCNEVVKMFPPGASQREKAERVLATIRQK